MYYDADRKVLPPSEINNYRDCKIMKHPTQKPIELTRRLIQSKINGQSGRVLIPFAGSGSECIVANELGIEWLGIEINDEYLNLQTNGWSSIRLTHRMKQKFPSTTIQYHLQIKSGKYSGKRDPKLQLSGHRLGRYNRDLKSSH